MKNLQVLFNRKPNVELSEVLTWSEIVPFLETEPKKERCPIFTL